MQQNVDRINGEIGRVQAELEEILESLTGTKEDMDRKKRGYRKAAADDRCFLYLAG